MPAKYQPTGRPPGRPAKSTVEKQNIADVREIFRNTTLDPRSVPLNNICPDCFPGGWDEAFPRGYINTSAVVACQHGTWVKR